MTYPPSPEQVDTMVSPLREGTLSLNCLFDMLRVDRGSMSEADLIQEIDRFYTVLVVLES